MGGQQVSWGKLTLHLYKGPGLKGESAPPLFPLPNSPIPLKTPLPAARRDAFRTGGKEEEEKKSFSPSEEESSSTLFFSVVHTAGV